MSEGKNHRDAILIREGSIWSLARLISAGVVQNKRCIRQQDDGKRHHRTHLYQRISLSATPHRVFRRAAPELGRKQPASRRTSSGHRRKVTIVSAVHKTFLGYRTHNKVFVLIEKLCPGILNVLFQFSIFCKHGFERILPARIGEP